MTQERAGEPRSGATFITPHLGVASDASWVECEFAVLVSKHHQRLLDLASTLLSREEAPDLVQDALFACWQRIADPDTPYVPRHVEAFLYQRVVDAAHDA